MRLGSRLKALELKTGISHRGDLEYHTLGLLVEPGAQVVACTLPEHDGRGCIVSVARGFGLPDGRNRIMEIVGEP